MDKLDEIMAWKRSEIAARVRPVQASELVRFAGTESPGDSFIDALADPSQLSVISEIKRRSPSAGAIVAESISAGELARRLYNAGTDAISVLTDEKYFSGHIRDLWEVNDLLGHRQDAPPTLRKDFFVHPVQVLEAAEARARAILIIVRALSDDEIGALQNAADMAQLDCLFEVHTEADLERALAFQPKAIGVNNRDLARFTTDLSQSEVLLPQIPDEVISISESGINDPEDAARVRAAGADAILVGEALMRAQDPASLIREMHRV